MNRRTGRISYLLLFQFTAAVIALTGVARAIDVGAYFVHTATLDNIAPGVSRIDHPLTNDDLSAIIHVTQNYNPGGVGGTYNDHVLGVAYSDYYSQWIVFHHDGTTPSLGAAFNIWVAPADASSFVHTATPATITNNHTVIDNPLTNGNPSAILRVTNNANPSGGPWVYNDHAVGVWYNGSKWAIFNQDLAVMPDHASFNVTVLPDEPTVAVHTATPENTIGNWTAIDHPLTNNNPNAIVSITQTLNPGGGGWVYNDHVVGVWYHDGIEQWAVFNQDLAAMPVGASFNVSAPSLVSASFIHSADPGNTIFMTTYVDHPLSSGNPHAILFVTQNWNPGGAGGVLNDHSVGTFYDSTRSKSGVFNQDLETIPEGASFNISIPAVDTSTFVHRATVNNISDNWTTIDHPLANGNPDAIIHTIQNHGPSGVLGVLNDHTIGVWYDGANWAIFNQDHTDIPENASFNVSINTGDTATFVHTASAANTSGSSTVFHHPASDGNPHAIVQVTQSWNPPGSSGIYNDHEISVWYDDGAWSIFNQDDAPMPEGASFNVTVVDPPFFTDGFESGDTSVWSAVVP